MVGKVLARESREVGKVCTRAGYHSLVLVEVLGRRRRHGVVLDVVAYLQGDGLVGTIVVDALPFPRYCTICFAKKGVVGEKLLYTFRIQYYFAC